MDPSDVRITCRWRGQKSPHVSVRALGCFKEGGKGRVPDVPLIWHWGFLTNLFRKKQKMYDANYTLKVGSDLFQCCGFAWVFLLPHISRCLCIFFCSLFGLCSSYFPYKIVIGQPVWQTNQMGETGHVIIVSYYLSFTRAGHGLWPGS